MYTFFSYCFDRKVQRFCPLTLRHYICIFGPKGAIQICYYYYYYYYNDSYFKTFNDLAEIIVKRLVRKLRNSDVDAVTLEFDRYDVDLSIKAGERQRRCANPESASTYQIMRNRPVPNYRQFLKGSGNKAALADFVTRYVLENVRERLPTDCCIIVSAGLKQGEVVQCISG